MARIVDKKINLDYAQVSDFFEKRGEGKELKSKYNYVLFQDDHPELAKQRDRQEKEKITPMLDWKRELNMSMWTAAANS